MAFDGTGSSNSVLNEVRMFYGSWNSGDNGMLSVTGGAKLNSILMFLHMIAS